jgi:hypothetical protein
MSNFYYTQVTIFYGMPRGRLERLNKSKKYKIAKVQEFNLTDFEN